MTDDELLAESLAAGTVLSINFFDLILSCGCDFDDEAPTLLGFEVVDVCGGLRFEILEASVLGFELLVDIFSSMAVHGEVT